MPAPAESMSVQPCRVERVETFLLDIPTIRPHRLSVATLNGQTLMVVRITSSDGVVGIGEATTISGLAYGAESPEGMKVAIDNYITPVLATCDPTRVASAMARIGKSVKGNHFAKCAIEMALMDARGKRVGLPVSELLGGRQRDRLSVAWTLASGDTAKDIAECEAMLAARRHNVFKLKIGLRSIKDDVAHVAAIKKSQGDAISVRVDVNMAWSAAEAIDGASRLADVGCDLLEQPVAQDAALARVSQRSPIPVMADESLCGPESAFRLASAAAASAFSVKIEPSGGLFAASRVAAIADAAGVDLYGGTMLEGPIATIAAAHLFATFPGLTWGTELFGPLLLTEEILAEPLRYSDFELAVPAGPGLGLTLDEDRLRFFRRDGERRVMSSPSKGS
jgi:muconate cycloisomerase